MISVASGTFALGGDFTKNGGTLLLEDITLSLLSDLQWTSHSLVEIKQLELNNLTLTLGNESSDLKINNPLILDQINEKLITGAADLELNELLSISNGELSSSGGEIRLNNGLDISGGKVEFLNSSLLIGSELGSQVSLIQSGGFLLADTSSLQLIQNLNLQSTEGFSFQSLDLNSRELSLASETSSLSLKEKLIIDLISEKINTGSADLRLEGGIRMSAGEISSSG